MICAGLRCGVARRSRACANGLSTLSRRRLPPGLDGAERAEKTCEAILKGLEMLAAMRLIAPGVTAQHAIQTAGG
ncbi:hypothetical protein KCP73_21230 [Salmonella enterica subsp. enterica]|nr:hypothetical protein KCP73_21230 [Salmonella enterica subsp. enterica]